MNKIADTFSTLQEKKEGALVLFVTAGDPDIRQLPQILAALAEGGADIIEVGLPFSDPIADGPTIQASSQRALDMGTRLQDVFDALKGFQGPPVVLMGYMNSILRHGYGGFAQRAVESGVSGVIVCDLTPDEADPWIAEASQNGLDTIFLAAPNSTEERLDLVCEKASGFVYALSRTGVTGQSANVSDEVHGLVTKIKSRTRMPVCVGFGISRPEHVREVCGVADGAIIGSWLVEFIHQHWDEGRGREQVVAAVKELKAATRH